MNLCNNGHDEVCYEGRHCPACAVADDLNRDISKLEEKIADLEYELKEAQEANQ